MAITSGRKQSVLNLRPRSGPLTFKESHEPYERLLEELAEEGQRRCKLLPSVRSLDLKVLVRRLEDSSRRQGYVANLSMMHRLIAQYPRIAGEGMRL